MTSNKRILIMGLPGSGKTTLARALAKRIGAVHFNTDEVRSNINRDLGFSVEDRIEHARRMGWLCEQVAKAGQYVIADFVCPIPQTRVAFGEAFIVWMVRIQAGRFPDTNRLFVAPERYDILVPAEGTPEDWAVRIMADLRIAASGSPPKVQIEAARAEAASAQATAERFQKASGLRGRAIRWLAR